MVLVGSELVSSLDEWLDIFENNPVEHFGSYDGEEHKVTNCSDDIIKKILYTPTVAYFE